jgi:hypothetical protein
MNPEMALKNTDAFDEQYNIWTAAGYTRLAYITTCFPARFWKRSEQGGEGISRDRT